MDLHLVLACVHLQQTVKSHLAVNILGVQICRWMMLLASLSFWWRLGPVGWRLSPHSCSTCKPCWPGTRAATQLRWGSALPDWHRQLLCLQASLAWHKSSSSAQVGPE